MQAAQPDPAEAPSGGPRSDRPVERAGGTQWGVGQFPGRRPALGELHLKLLERLGPPSALVDAAHEILHLSPQAGRFLRLRGGEPSRQLLAMVDPALRPALAAALQQAGQSDAEVRSAPVELDCGGERLTLSVRVVPAADLGPGLQLLLFEAGPAAAPAAEARLVELERAARDLLDMLEASGIPTVFVDAGLRVRRYTGAATRLFSLVPADHGRRLTGLATPLAYPELAADLERVVQRQEPVEREVGDRDGRCYLARLLPQRTTGDELAGVVLSFVDVSDALRARQALQASEAELRQALEETRQARRALEAADANQDRFLAVLSHELRNPLSSIASASELLLMAQLPESARHKAAEVVQRQARAMKALLDELLDVSRLTLGRLGLERYPVSVASVVQSALEATRPLVQAASHELRVWLPPPAVQVDGDPVRLAQVVSNLVTNAAKFTPESGRIEVSAEVFHDEVVITVSDNGIGMEPSQIDRMFDLFSQGQDALDRSNAGLGIGLALARNIVELHGGWILASSPGIGHGCQVRVGLPLLPGSVARGADAGEPPPQRAPEPAIAAEGELILVADDNGDAAWGLAKLLELSGFRAVLARSGGEALSVAEHERPAVALLDIGMPDLSGHEVARRLRQSPWGRDMILIAATGWGQEEDIRQSMEAGFDAHLTKPLNVARIRGLIEELAARRRG